MNHGPIIFLVALLGLAGSWFGFVLTPQMQVGQLVQTNVVGGSSSYPLARPGLAAQGREVYRANGCASCHSQQVSQTGTVCDLVLTEPGTNPPALLAALTKFAPGVKESDLKVPPKPVLQGLSKETADARAKELNRTGARTAVWIVPVGLDISRGWGKRRTVAEDYLYDYPVMPGSLRAGPDLANVGIRQPDPHWHLRHLYAPKSQVSDSSMPSYRYLFEKRKVARAPSPDALALPGKWAAPDGFEIVPKPEAQALAAYLVSLRADAPLFVAPFTPAAPAAVVSTNSPADTAATATNAPPK